MKGIASWRTSEGFLPSLATHLQVGECNLMLDCGWDERFSLDLVEPLREWAPKVDAVLLSHCSLEHIGALPYAMGKLGMKAKVYGTLPVQKMGSLLMYDQVEPPRPPFCWMEGSESPWGWVRHSSR